MHSAHACEPEQRWSEPLPQDQCSRARTKVNGAVSMVSTCQCARESCDCAPMKDWDGDLRRRVLLLIAMAAVKVSMAV